MLNKFMLSYRYVLLMTIVHSVYSAFMWYKRDPLDRKIWPLGTQHAIRASNFAWLVVVYALGLIVWAFVYGALTSCTLLSEDLDAEQEKIRQELIKTDCAATVRDLLASSITLILVVWCVDCELHRPHQRPV